MGERRLSTDPRRMHQFRNEPPARSESGRASADRRSSLSFRPPLLSDSVQFLKGVGPYRAKILDKLGVSTVEDLILYFPFRHEHIPRSRAIGTLRLNETATLIGELRNPRTTRSSKGDLISGTLVDGTGRCRVRWFNSAYLKDDIVSHRIIRVTGKVDAFDDIAVITNPRTTFIDDARHAFDDDRERFEPVYSATSELPSRLIGALIASLLDVCKDQIVDWLPTKLRESRKLPPRAVSIQRWHAPTSMQDIAKARHRIAYDELLLSQLAVMVSKIRRTGGPAASPVKITDEIDRRIRKRFPFELSPGQNRAIADIRRDLAQSKPMNRLLQADVGAGKTAVAVYAALGAIANKKQVALAAPTEVLAQQHFQKISKYLADSRVHIAYLRGSVSRSVRAVTLGRLKSGEVDFAIGTHALFEKDVEFRNLGLVIVDEQHRFGVRQRGQLYSKGVAPHRLSLTATPIPRTLAMTVFGELDVSTIDGSPPGRQDVVTRLVTAEKHTLAWDFMRKRLLAGEQAYVVYPLVDENDSMPLKAATAEIKRIEAGVLRGCRLALLHGRMSALDKQQTMERFHAGEIQVLVSTTVIEVGVDVANATVMMIQHADRYGLSQLHQLRGRVGRGTKKSYCLLMVDRSEVESKVASDVAIDSSFPRRLQILCDTNDGFRIAEEDLRLRGPGEFLGTRQHGLPQFRAADLATDWELLQTARTDAAAILQRDPNLTFAEHAPLKTALLQAYGESLSYPDFG